MICPFSVKGCRTGDLALVNSMDKNEIVFRFCLHTQPVCTYHIVAVGSPCFLIGLFLFVCLFDLILYVPSTIFQLNRDGSSWVEPVLS